MYSLLKGVRILDFTRLIPGAYATAKLADLGADVIKLEQPPTGDYMRQIPPMFEGESLLYQALNRNKRSVAVALDTPEGRKTFEDLVKASDVFIEGGRPGAAARVNADYEALNKLNPKIIYCSISGYGQDGPYADLPSHGANLEAAAGFVDIEPREDGTADIPNIRVFMASQSGGTHAALAIAAALNKVHTTGEGCYLDVGCWDGAVSWRYGDLTFLANTGGFFPGSEGLGPKYGCYQTSDSRWVMIALIEKKFWAKFCAAVDRPDLAEWVADGGLADFGADDDELRTKIRELLRSRTQDDWVKLAVSEQLPMSPVLSPKELLDNEHVAVRKVFTEVKNPSTGQPVRMLTLPIKVGGEEFEVRNAAPAMGEQTEEILSEIRSS